LRQVWRYVEQSRRSWKLQYLGNLGLAAECSIPEFGIYRGRSVFLPLRQQSSINRKIKNKICGADDLEGVGLRVTGGGSHIFRPPLPGGDPIEVRLPARTLCGPLQDAER
jgi:hypothetical protein